MILTNLMCVRIRGKYLAVTLRGITAVTLEVMMYATTVVILEVMMGAMKCVTLTVTPGVSPGTGLGVSAMTGIDLRPGLSHLTAIYRLSTRINMTHMRTAVTTTIFTGMIGMIARVMTQSLRTIVGART
jgi:hypothetical protein